MRDRPVIPAAALVAIVAAINLGACGARGPDASREPPQTGRLGVSVAARQGPLVAEARARALPGDVLFKDGGGLWGSLAAGFSENDDGYGHVGLVAAGADGGLVVIHAGGDPATPSGRVQEASLDFFLRSARAAALYRPKIDSARAGAALAYAHAAVRRDAPFDATFSLATEDELYCTELVWRALSAALGEDAIPHKSERGGKVYVAIDDLQDSPSLAAIWRGEAKDPSAAP